MIFGKKKEIKCAICGKTLDDKCGLKYRFKSRRYTPDGWYAAMPIRGAICERCVKVGMDMIRERVLVKEVKVS